MTKEQALQIIQRTGEQLKEGGFDFLLFASKPTGARVDCFAEQTIVSMLKAEKIDDFVSALAVYTIEEQGFMKVLVDVGEEIGAILDKAITLEDLEEDEPGESN